MSSTRDLDQIRAAALARIDRSERHFTIALVVTAVWRACSSSPFIWQTDFGDPLHRLVFFATFLTYGTLGLGLCALAAHVNRVAQRGLKAIELAGLGDGPAAQES